MSIVPFDLNWGDSRWERYEIKSPATRPPNNRWTARFVGYSSEWPTEPYSLYDQVGRQFRLLDEYAHQAGLVHLVVHCMQPNRFRRIQVVYLSKARKGWAR